MGRSILHSCKHSGYCFQSVIEVVARNGNLLSFHTHYCIQLFFLKCCFCCSLRGPIIEALNLVLTSLSSFYCPFPSQGNRPSFLIPIHLFAWNVAPDNSKFSECPFYTTYYPVGLIYIPFKSSKYPVYRVLLITTYPFTSEKTEIQRG